MASPPSSTDIVPHQLNVIVVVINNEHYAFWTPARNFFRAHSAMSQDRRSTIKLKIHWQMGFFPGARPGVRQTPSLNSAPFRMTHPERRAMFLACELIKIK